MSQEILIKHLKKIGCKLMNLLFYLCMALIFLGLVQLFCFTSFKIPSDSMAPTLWAGDKIVVNKLIKGARLFNITGALNQEDIDIYRMPALGTLKRNDVLVFNFPYQKGRWDSIAFDIMKYYVKRCIALPGDTLEIKNGFYRIAGVTATLGNRSAQERISGLKNGEQWGVVMGAFPQNTSLGWTIKEFGPLVVPVKGQTMPITQREGELYRQLISWEQKKKVKVDNGYVLIEDSVINEYTFCENYYFVSGDKMENSQDSRYWGLLPEPYIVGKATLIWKSVDVLTGKIRWNRVFKKIK